LIYILSTIHEFESQVCSNNLIKFGSKFVEQYNVTNQSFVIVVFSLKNK